MKKIVLILVSVVIMMTMSGCGRDALESENRTYVDHIVTLEEKIESLSRMNETLGVEIETVINSETDHVMPMYESFIQKNNQLKVEGTDYTYLDIKTCYSNAQDFHLLFTTNTIYDEHEKTVEGLDDTFLQQHNWKTIEQYGVLMTRDKFEDFLSTMFSQSVVEVYMNEIKDYNRQNPIAGSMLFYNDYLVIETIDAGFDGFSQPLYTELYINRIVSVDDQVIQVEAELPIRNLEFTNGKKVIKYEYETTSFRVMITSHGLVFDSNIFHL